LKLRPEAQPEAIKSILHSVEKGFAAMSPLLHPLLWSADWIRRQHVKYKGPACTLLACAGPQTISQKLGLRRTGSFLDEKFYCQPRCLETALVAQISRLYSMPSAMQAPNRIPLGLLMVARGKLTHCEVQAALEAQRRARYGKIGDWLEKLGFASEEDVTAALALQWGSPLVSSFDLGVVDTPGNIPLPILDAFQMLPANYAATTRTLYLAFGERVDHAALHAIERTLACRIQPCVASRKQIACRLESMQQLNRPGDVEFVTRDLREITRIASSYMNRISPQDVHLSRVGHFIWLRLRARSEATNLVFNLRSNISSRAPALASLSASLAAITYSPANALGDNPISMGG
jgi:hypothetical protein